MEPQLTPRPIVEEIIRPPKKKKSCLRWFIASIVFVIVVFAVYFVCEVYYYSDGICGVTEIKLIKNTILHYSLEAWDRENLTVGKSLEDGTLVYGQVYQLIQIGNDFSNTDLLMCLRDYKKETIMSMGFTVR